MQLQFNNSPLGGGGGINPWKGETRFFFFLFAVVVFGVSGSLPPPHPPRDGRSDWRKRGGLFCTFCFPTQHTHTCAELVWWDAAEAVIDWTPLTEWTLSQAVLCAQAAGCVYWCVLPAKSRHQHHRRQHRQQQQQHEGLTSSSNPPQILSGLLNRNNGIPSSVLAACKPRKIARVVIHDYHS